MASLLAEYRKRHKKNFVSSTNEGVCFFDVNNIPTAVCLTSLSSRSIVTCWRCAERPCSMIVEMFQMTPRSLYQSLHGHYEPDTDLVKVVTSSGIRDATPFMPKTQRDLEVWLWRFFSSKKSPVSETITELQAVEAMAYSAMYFPKNYAAYYVLFEKFLLGRKYLMFGGNL